ncbi:MAG: trypsin-like peptidase domain-containing protein [Oscillospiraceae bacterium]|nr:trypsin-like peptidase domain-containing protein [Oscillospiraceae bacterium]
MKRINKALCGTVLAVMISAMLTGAVFASPMDTRTLAMVNKPGVVMLYTEYTASMTWYEFMIDDGIYDYITSDIVDMLENGEIGEYDVMSAVIQLFTEYLQYFAYTTGNSRTDMVSTGYVGTGFIVTPDGYLVTNAHVVETDQDELYYSFAVSNLMSEVESEVTDFVEQMRREGYQLTSDEIEAMYGALFTLYAQNFDIKNIQPHYFCFMGNVQPGADISTKGMLMDLRKVGTPSSSRDIAILKMDGNNFPTVPLGDDSTLKTGDEIYAMGYPAIATVYGVVDAPHAMQEPTLTRGIVSAKKQWNDGGSIIQMDAAIHGGNSGGPLFNAKGEVVGINTFGLVDPGTGGEVAGVYFSVPISTAKIYLNELNITPTESKFTSDFKTALASYNSGDYSAALELLRGINETNPGYPVVQELLADARTAYDANPSPSSSAPPSSAEPPPVTPATSEPPPPVTASNESSPTVTSDTTGEPGISSVTLIIIIAAAVVVIAVVLIIVLVLGKKKKGAAPQQQRTPSQQQYAPPQRQNMPEAPQPATPDATQQAPQKPASAFCDQCGAQLTQNSKFCASCGARKD